MSLHLLQRLHPNLNSLAPTSTLHILLHYASEVSHAIDSINQSPPAFAGGRTRHDRIITSAVTQGGIAARCDRAEWWNRVEREVVRTVHPARWPESTRYL